MYMLNKEDLRMQEGILPLQVPFFVHVLVELPSIDVPLGHE